MRKLMMLLLLGVLALGILPGVSAAPVDELTALAQYFPDTTLAFIAIRSDDALFTELDGLVAKVAAKLPPGTLPTGVTLESLLDMGALQLTGSDFAGGIRSWLGDTIAVGGQSFIALGGTSPQVAVAVEITDRAAAESFVGGLAAMGGLELSTQPPDGYTMYESNRPGGGVVLIGDGVLFAAQDEVGVKSVLNIDNPLSESSRFTTTVGLLPADSYNLIVYTDSAQMFTSGQMGGGAMAATLLEAQAVGFTLLDGDTLTMDIAANLGDIASLTESMGYPLPQLGPVDPAFATNISGDASLVFHASNFKDLANGYLNIQLSNMGGGGGSTLQEMRETIKQQVQATTGLDLDADILDWMTGDFAMWLSLDTPVLMDIIEDSLRPISEGGNPGSPPVFEELPFGFGLVFEATDPEKAQNLSVALGNVIRQFGGQAPNTTISSEQISGVDVTVVSVTDTSGLTLDIAVGANENVFFVADRASVTAILSGDGTLAQSQSFVEAGAYLLPDSTTVFYSDENGAGGTIVIFGLALLGPSIGNVFNNIVDELQGTPSPEELARREEERRRQEEQNRLLIVGLRSLMTIIESGSASSTVTAEGDTVIRFVLTLAE